MIALQPGSVVKSIAGRDKERHYVVVRAENEYVFIADGKVRKLARPKAKNKKHIAPTKHIIPVTDDTTDKALRQTLGEMNRRAAGAK